MRYWDKRRRAYDCPITVILEFTNRRGIVRESPRLGRVLASFPDGGAAGGSPERCIPLDDLTEASRFAIWDAKCHYTDDEQAG